MREGCLPWQHRQVCQQSQQLLDSALEIAAWRFTYRMSGHRSTYRTYRSGILKQEHSYTLEDSQSTSFLLLWQRPNRLMMKGAIESPHFNAIHVNWDRFYRQPAIMYQIMIQTKLLVFVDFSCFSRVSFSTAIRSLRAPPRSFQRFVCFARAPKSCRSCRKRWTRGTCRCPRTWCRRCGEKRWRRHRTCLFPPGFVWKWGIPPIIAI